MTPEAKFYAFFVLPLIVFIVAMYLLIKELRLRRDYKNYLKRKAAKDLVAADIDNYKWKGLDTHVDLTAEDVRNALEAKKQSTNNLT